MNDLSELEPTTKEMAIAILIVVAVLVAVFCAGYSVGISNAGTDIRDNGNRIDDVREQYQHIEVNQREITDGLKGAVERSNSIEERSDRIEKAAGTAAQSVTDAGIILDECQQIVGRIRNRGQKGTTAN